jgi:hypothetical protein
MTAELFHANGRTDGHTDSHDKKNIHFSKLVKAPKSNFRIQNIVLRLGGRISEAITRMANRHGWSLSPPCALIYCSTYKDRMQ